MVGSREGARTADDGMAPEIDCCDIGRADARDLVGKGRGVEVGSGRGSVSDTVDVGPEMRCEYYSHTNHGVFSNSPSANLTKDIDIVIEVIEYNITKNKENTLEKLLISNITTIS